MRLPDPLPRAWRTPLLIAALAWPVGASASGSADRFILTGSIRARIEAVDNAPRTGVGRSETLISLRSQLLGEYRARGWRVGVELFDSRAYGADAATPLTTGDVNAVEMVQAYVAADITDPFGTATHATVVAGRMRFSIGSRRLLATNEYRNTTNAFTGLRAEMALPRETQATLLYLLPQTRLPDDALGIRNQAVRLDRENFDTLLWGGHVSRRAVLGRFNAEVTFLHLRERDALGRPTRDRTLDTYGGRLIAEPAPGKADVEIEAFRQTGRASAATGATATRLPVRASFVHAELGYTFAAPWQPRFAIEFDRASGDRGGSHYGRFDTLYGTRRGDFAPSGIYGAVGRANILAPGLRLEAAPSPRTELSSAWKALWLDSATDSFSTSGVRDASARSGRFAGHQFDLRLRHWLRPNHLRAELNAILLAKGRFLRDAPNAPPGTLSRYAAFSLTASF
jgi:hypothetical protein